MYVLAGRHLTSTSLSFLSIICISSFFPFTHCLSIFFYSVLPLEKKYLRVFTHQSITCHNCAFSCHQLYPIQSILYYVLCHPTHLSQPTSTDRAQQERRARERHERVTRLSPICRTPVSLFSKFHMCYELIMIYYCSSPILNMTKTLMLPVVDRVLFSFMSVCVS